MRQLVDEVVDLVGGRDPGERPGNRPRVPCPRRGVGLLALGDAPDELLDVERLGVAFVSASQNPRRSGSSSASSSARAFEIRSASVASVAIAARSESSRSRPVCSPTVVRKRS